MERHCKTKKQKKESCEKRSPLQNLNRLPFIKPITEKCSKFSSSSSAPSVSRDPKKNSRFLLSSVSSSSSSSTSCSGINLDERPKTFGRSKENQISQKSKRNQPQCHARRVYGKTNAKPICKSGPRSKLSSALGNPENRSKKGSQEFQAKTKNSRENGSDKRAFEISNLNSAENCTPVGRVADGHGLDSENFVDNETVVEDLIYESENCNSGNAVKTPPVEASLSPEIQRQSNSKMLVLKSAATPVCYGAGHLLSGVTDKRKCKRRGSLRGGSEKVNLFYGERGDEDVSDDLKECSIPSLAEASVRWHLSPCNEGIENLGIELDHFRVIRGDDALGKLDLLSSNSIICGNESDLMGCDSSYSGSDGVASKRRNRNALVSPRKASEGLLRPFNYNVVGSLSVTSPKNAYRGNGISSKEIPFSENLTSDNSKLSIGSLSIEDVIQTPDSGSNSDVNVGRSRLEVHHSNFVWPELDSITKTLEGVNLSPRNEMPMWDAPDLGHHFPEASPPISVGPTQLQKNVNSVSSSWVSDTTFANLSLSQMRVSWRDGLGNETVGADELECCCFLSDEEANAGESAREQLMGDKTCQRTYPGTESGQSKKRDLRIGNDLSPLVLDYEPCISTRAKEKSSSHRADACSESICTNGGSLVASDDSEWSYFHENRLFQVK